MNSTIGIFKKNLTLLYIILVLTIVVKAKAESLDVETKKSLAVLLPANKDGMQEGLILSQVDLRGRNSFLASYTLNNKIVRSIPVPRSFFDRKVLDWNTRIVPFKMTIPFKGFCESRSFAFSQTIDSNKHNFNLQCLTNKQAVEDFSIWYKSIRDKIIAY